MANSISDVTVNVTVADVIFDAEFGIPLLYLPAASLAVDYTECYDLSEVRKATAAIYGGSTNYAAALEDLTGSTYSTEELSEEFDNLSFAKGGVYTIEENEVTYEGVEYNKRITLTNVNYITLAAQKSGLMRIICTADGTATATAVVRKGTIPSTNGVVSRTSLSGTGISSIVVEVDEGESYCIYADTTTPFKVYAIYVDVPSTESGVIIEQAKRIFGSELPPEKIAVLCCPTSMLPNYESYNWRQLIYNARYNSSSVQYAKEIAEYIEYFEDFKLFYFECGTPVRDDLDFSVLTSFERTIIGVAAITDDGYTSPVNSALVGATATKPVGSYTYKNIVLKNVEPYANIKKSALDKIHNAGAICCVTKAGYNVSSEGKTANGEYIDVVDAKDWIVMQIRYQLQQALIINDKIPYTNNGISMLESYVINVLQQAFINGMIAEDDDGKPAFTVNFARRSETKQSDRAKREYTQGRFSFDLAGAIHKVTINGVINI